jgi:hypothetical protein
MELMRWPSMRELYLPVFSTEQAFIEDEQLWEDLHSRVIEHVCQPTFNESMCKVYLYLSLSLALSLSLCVRARVNRTFV